MSYDPNTILFSSIKSLEEFQEITKGAQIIWARDKRTGNDSLVYGKSFLEAIAQEVMPPQELRKIVRFVIDFSSKKTELERLLTAVEVTFGCHEYE